MTAPPAARLACAVTPLGGAAPGLAGELAELRARMPRLEVTIQVADREEVAEAIARGDADLGLIDGITAPNDPLPLPLPLSAVGVAEGPAAVIVPAGHPLAAGHASALRLADLADARWIDAPSVAPPLADLRRAAGTEGFRPALRYDGTDTLSLLRLAAEGHGLTVLPAALLSALPHSAAVAIGVSAPRLVHRVEMIHGTLPGDSPAAALAALLSATVRAT
jgi:DNA-binding transcriptional LysR family regulator